MKEKTVNICNDKTVTDSALRYFRYSKQNMLPYMLVNIYYCY